MLAVPIAATLAVLGRYVVRYYESTHFFGHESDADIVVTPAMALIMPGKPWTPGVWEDGHSVIEEHSEIALEGDEPPPVSEANDAPPDHETPDEEPEP